MEIVKNEGITQKNIMQLLKKISDFYYDTEKQPRKAFEDVIQSLKKRNEDNCVIIRDEKAANEKWQETDIWFTLYEKKR